MSLRKPPALADWLLNRLHLPESNPPLAGDLLEEFHSGRSRAWYWRQTIAAIAARARHNLRPATLIFIGWVAQVSVVYALWRSHLPAPVPGRIYEPVAMLAWVVVMWGVGSRESWVGKVRSTVFNFVKICGDTLIDMADFGATVWGRFSPSSDLDHVRRAMTIGMPAVTFFMYLGIYLFFALVQRWESLGWLLTCEISWLLKDEIGILLSPTEFTSS